MELLHVRKGFEAWGLSYTEPTGVTAVPYWGPGVYSETTKTLGFEPKPLGPCGLCHVGILVGIGETREERLESLQDLLYQHQRYGHIQEIIIQNFRCGMPFCIIGSTQFLSPRMTCMKNLLCMKSCVRCVLYNEKEWGPLIRYGEHFEGKGVEGSGRPHLMNAPLLLLVLLLIFLF
jgi:hypothetical protein